MTLYYSLVFLLLVTEMVIFMALIIPLPFTWRRKLFTFISESPIIAKLQYGMKITFIFILILFIDSVNRVYRVQIELAAAHKSQNRGGAAVLGGSERMEVQARKFYSQRNMYLCGFTLFLSLILNRTYVMILDVLRLEEEVKTLRGDPAVKGKGKGSSLQNAGNAGEIGRLKQELAARDRDLANLKKQVEGVSREYNRMADQITPSDSTPKKER
ncbi:putative BAP31 domain protein [Cenococcum geophilum 1.58]|uniref:BAP31 domain protein n=1 Tax=Cenococcum geophilum 1.58 TaxID=794803 RepID=A0ACC8EQB9_9PEZI|nr:putative BAP31 domain protein [Cenococcum geophilum 1.58]